MNVIWCDLVVCLVMSWCMVGACHVCLLCRFVWRVRLFLVRMCARLRWFLLMNFEWRGCKGFCLWTLIREDARSFWLVTYWGGEAAIELYEERTSGLRAGRWWGSWRSSGFHHIALSCFRCRIMLVWCWIIVIRNAFLTGHVALGCANAMSAVVQTLVKMWAAIKWVRAKKTSGPYRRAPEPVPLELPPAVAAAREET